MTPYAKAELTHADVMELEQLENIRRRELISGALAAAFLVACGGDDDDTDTGPTPTPEPLTRVVETMNGPVEVPTHPQRIVSLLLSTAQLLDLGITPVGVLRESESNYLPEDWAKLRTIPIVGVSETEIDIEKVASLAPDLIISGQRREEDFGYAKLSEIAPTTFYQVETPAEVRTAMPRFADAANRGADMSAKIAAYEARTAEIKSKYSDLLSNTRWAYVEGNASGLVVNSPVSWPGLFMGAAGLRFPGLVEDVQVRGVRLSFERINELMDVDVILYAATPDGAPDSGTTGLLDQPAWKLLPSTQSGRQYPLRYPYAYSYKGAMNILAQLEEVMKKESSR